MRSITNIRKLAESVSSLGIFILFPGFIIYHLLLAMDFISPLLAGLFGPIAVVILMVYIIILAFILQQPLNASPVFFTSTILFYIFAICWILGHYLTISEQYIGTASLSALTGLILGGALFFIGLQFSYEKKYIVKLFAVLMLGMFASLLYFAYTTNEVMFSLHKNIDVDNPDSIASYQGIARSIIVMAVLVFSFYKGFVERIAIMIVSVFILFFIGARSELYGFLFFCLVYLLFRSVKNMKWLVFTVFVLAGIFYFGSSNSEWLSKSRQIEVTNLSESTSWQMRKEFQNTALNQIKDSPLFGYFGGDLVANGCKGCEAHNVLSAWVTYGLFGFLLYTSLIAGATFISSYYFFKYPMSAYWTLSFAVNCICLFLIIASKSVLWALPPLGWGLYINARVKQKNANKYCNKVSSGQLGKINFPK